MYLQKACSEVTPLSTAAELDQAQPQRTRDPRSRNCRKSGRNLKILELRYRHRHLTGSALNPLEQKIQATKANKTPAWLIGQQPPCAYCSRKPGAHSRACRIML